VIISPIDLVKVHRSEHVVMALLHKSGRYFTSSVFFSFQSRSSMQRWDVYPRSSAPSPVSIHARPNGKDLKLCICLVNCLTAH